MFEEVLIKDTKEHLALLGRAGILKDAYLAGGSGCALQLGHRLSIDFDFFTSKKFESHVVSSELARVAAFEVEEIDKGTILGKFMGTRFSLFFYQYPLIFAPIPYLSLRIADVRDIAAMKIDAIASRGTKRDFIDLYFVCQNNYRLEDLLDLYDKKYGILASNLMHIKKSLIFFEDADSDAMPVMLMDVKWNDVKLYFEAEVKKLFRK